MLKKASAAVLAALILSATAGSVAAADLDSGADAETLIFGRSESATISALEQRGVKATRVEQWGQYVRAFVTEDNGSRSQQFFARDGLSRVAL